MFPVYLDVRDRSCLVVGGGPVGWRKARQLAAEGARVTVVSPQVVPHLARAAEQGRVRLEKRCYRAGEAAGYALVFAATDDRPVNEQVARDGERAGVWVNVADDPPLCSFHMPATLKRGALELAIGTGGVAPFAARRLRQLLERHIGPLWSAWTAAAGAFRERVLASAVDPARRDALFDQFFAATVDAETLAAQLPDEEQMASWIAAASPHHRPAELAGRHEEETHATVALPGFVSLVGAGPGAPGLLTLTGRERLLTADAVVYDRLAAPALCPDLDPDVELYPVGKCAGNHPVPQEEINALLVRLAAQGKRVVRFKGGDPLVFGRGSEEAEALVAAGIPFEIIPGVTAAVAAAAWSGIPVTHRGESVGVTLVTAHEACKAGSPQVQWRQLARLEHQTLAGYMGLATLPWVVDELLAGGMNPAMPAVMIEQGTNPGQRRVDAPLAELPRRVREAGIAAPALFLVGPSIAHSATLDWRCDLPLAGRRVAAVGVGRELCTELEAKGAQLLSLRAPLLPAAEVALRSLPVTDLIVGTAADLERIRTEPSLRHTTVWCLCSTAAQRALECGIFSRVEEVPAADVARVMSSLTSLERNDGCVHENYPKPEPVADRGAVVRRPVLQ